MSLREIERENIGKQCPKRQVLGAVYLPVEATNGHPFDKGLDDMQALMRESFDATARVCDWHGRQQLVP